VFSDLQGHNAQTFETALGGTWAQLDLGVSGQMSKLTTLYATVNDSQGLSKAADHGVGGVIGVKVAW
jgi:outer membrane autotransporter protein